MLDTEYWKELHALDLKDAELLIPKSDIEIEKMLPYANILLADPPIAHKHINQAKNVVWMQSTFAGIDAMVEDSLRCDYILTNVRDVYGKSIAEYVLTYALHFEREVERNLTNQKSKEWEYKLSKTLARKTMGIIGPGSIGKDIARVAKAFDMRTIGLKPKNEPVEHFDEIFASEDYVKFLSQANYVIGVLPSTELTRGMINADMFSEMKPEAVFMNVGRGDTVNEGDLASALNEKRIAGAVLDVFCEEPLSDSSPLWNLPNVFITPHIAAATLNTGIGIADVFSENYRRFVAGEELKFQIDFDKGY